MEFAIEQKNSKMSAILEQGVWLRNWQKQKSLFFQNFSSSNY